MPRNMSFMLTTKQMYAREKTHTIRDGWWNLKPGEIINAVEKCQGLKKGQRIVRICQIRVKIAREARLIDVTPELCIMEGFPNLTPDVFAMMLMQHNSKITLTKPLNFIEFEYI
jgi:hypothetical protein